MRQLWAVVVAAVLWSPVAAAGPAVLIVPGQEPASTRSPGGLVQANFNHIQDNVGFRWDVTPQGSINDGSNDCFDNGLTLQINGNSFSSQQHHMTVDGREFVLMRRFGNFSATRRVWIDGERGVARYMEIIENHAGNPQTFTVTLQTFLGDAAGSVVTSSGAEFSGTLGAEDVGIAAISRGNNRPSVLFLLADPGSAVRPTVTTSDRRQYQFTYTLEAPANGVAALVHMVAQRNGVTPQNVAEQFEPLYKRRIVRAEAPPELMERVANFKVTAGGLTIEGEPLLQPVAEQAEGLKVELADADVLIVDDETRLTGAITGETVVIETAWGSAVVPVNEVAMLVGGAGIDASMQVYLRNGEILAGDTAAMEVVFKANEGVEVPLAPAGIVAMFGKPGEFDGVAPPDAAALLHTTTGDRLAIKSLDVPVTLLTPWGVAQLTLNDIDYVERVDDPQTAHRVFLRDGSRLLGLLAGDVSVETTRFGPVRHPALSLKRVARVHVTPDSEEARAALEAELAAQAQAAAARPKVELAGDCLLAGVIDAETIAVATAVGVETLAVADIRAMERAEDAPGGPRFTIEMAGGKTHEGRLGERVLAVRCGERVWRVPVEQVMRYEVPEVEEAAEAEATAEASTDEAAVEETPAAIPPAAPAPMIGPAPARVAAPQP